MRRAPGFPFCRGSSVGPGKRGRKAQTSGWHKRQSSPALPGELDRAHKVTITHFTCRMPRLLENYAPTKRPKGRADAFSQAPRKKTNRSPIPDGSRLMGLHRSAGKVLVKLFQKLADSQGRALSRFPQKAESSGTKLKRGQLNGALLSLSARPHRRLVRKKRTPPDLHKTGASAEVATCYSISFLMPLCRMLS